MEKNDDLCPIGICELEQPAFMHLRSVNMQTLNKIEMLLELEDLTLAFAMFKQ